VKGLRFFHRDSLRDPLRWVLFLAALIRVVGLTWGLPNSDGWDDDGVAPRDFLVGVIETYTPGHYYTYPPLHLLLLTVTTLPVWAIRLLHSPSLEPAAIVATFVHTPTMTLLALGARLVSVAMSLGTVRVVGLIAKDLSGRNAELATTVVLALNMTLTYYGHTTNLDGPYLFWASLSLLFWMRGFAAPKDFLRAGLFAACAIATKDQAYALFLIAYPVSSFIGFVAGSLSFKQHGKHLVLAALLGLFALLLIDGAITNPTGFQSRLHFLLGTASQDHAYYTQNWTGRKQILVDLWTHARNFYPVVAFVPLLLIGLWTTSVKRTGMRAQSLAPFLVAVSFTLAFNFTARRTEARFELPQSVFLAVYAGIGAHELLAWAGSRFIRRFLVGLPLALASAYALYMCVAVDSALLSDPRYVVEEFLNLQAAPGQSVELYGNNVYLPRIPAKLRAWRVLGIGETPRNPLVGIEDLQVPFQDGDARKPDFIVVSEFWASRFLYDPLGLPEGYALRKAFLQSNRDDDARTFFRSLVSGQRAYDRVLTARYESKIFPAVDMHASTTREVWVFARRR
jgi:4-amino-4-deoxy-L-arabinose transferase-like glycosyltransferase